MRRVLEFDLRSSKRVLFWSVSSSLKKKKGPVIKQNLQSFLINPLREIDFPCSSIGTFEEAARLQNEGIKWVEEFQNNAETSQNYNFLQITKGYFDAGQITFQHLLNRISRNLHVENQAYKLYKSNDTNVFGTFKN